MVWWRRDRSDNKPATPEANAPRAPAGSPGDPPAETTEGSASSLEDQGAVDLKACLQEAMLIDGALGAALVDARTGHALATAGNPEGFDLEIAAAGNSEVVRAKLQTLNDLGLKQDIEDILITVENQYHIIRTLSGETSTFFYLVLDRARSNLALARYQLANIERHLSR